MRRSRETPTYSCRSRVNRRSGGVMLSLLVSTMLASLLGSAHCAGMCGAFAAFATAAPQERRVSSAALNAAYNGGRLISYTILGAIAGAVGASFDVAGSLFGVQRAALVGAAIIMIVFGCVAALRSCGVRIARVPVPAVLLKLARAGHARAFSLSPLARAATVGLLTTLLPCGWLYAFAVIAAGTADARLGAGVMLAFWLGTLPVMAAIGMGAKVIAGRIGAKFPLVTSVLLVGAGLWTLYGRSTAGVIQVGSVSAPTSIRQAADLAARGESLCPLCTGEPAERRPGGTTP